MLSEQYHISMGLERFLVRWTLNPVELGAAWAIVLLLVVAIEAFRVLRKRQSAA